MQLYKNRGFSEFFSDTFSFLKEDGKHFFKHFFIVNGIFILILMVLSYFFMSFYFEGIMSGMENPNALDGPDAFFNENLPLIIIFGSLFAIAVLVLGALIFSFTPIYLKLYSERRGPDFHTKEIVSEFRKNLGKIAVFFLVTLLISIPAFAIIIILCFVLFITIVGILFIPLLIAFVSLLYQLAFMEYLHTNKGVLQGYGYAWTLISKKFWAAVGSVALFYLMIQVIQGIVTLIPYMAGMFSIITDSERMESDLQGVSGTLITLMVIVYLVSFLISLIGNAVLQLNQGMVYYGLKEHTENIHTQNVIDTIGTSDN